jgi:hypothetical protein
MAKIVHTAKQTVKDNVLAIRALLCWPGVTGITKPSGNDPYDLLNISVLSILLPEEPLDADQLRDILFVSKQKLSLPIMLNRPSV